MRHAGRGLGRASERSTVRLIALAGCVVAALAAGLLGSALHASSAGRPAAWVSPAPSVTPSVRTSAAAEPDTGGPTLSAPDNPASIRLSGVRLFGWALLDRRTSLTVGSANSAKVTNTVESMIKPWIASDYLRRLAEAGKKPTDQVLAELTSMIVDSHDPLSEKYYRLGGSDALIRRLVSTCGLTRVTIKPTLWSWTLMTPDDGVRYGLCLADGRAAGPQWTSWILETMRKVRGKVSDQGEDSGGGRWGIIDGLPPQLARDTSIKNGWTLYVDGWHVNCLAVHRDWVLTIMIRTARGLPAAATGCQQVAARLVVNPQG